MTGTPKRIYAWPHFDGWITGDWSANTYYDERAVAYILADEHDRIVAEKDAEIARITAERDAAYERTAKIAENQNTLAGRLIAADIRAMIAARNEEGTW